jgi:hypothetical protein
MALRAVVAAQENLCTSPGVEGERLQRLCKQSVINRTLQAAEKLMFLPCRREQWASAH